MCAVLCGSPKKVMYTKARAQRESKESLKRAQLLFYGRIKLWRRAMDAKVESLALLSYTGPHLHQCSTSAALLISNDI